MWLGSCVAVAAAPIRPLAWEPPYAVGAAPPPQKKIMIRSSLVAQWVKDPALSMQRLGFNPWPRNFYMLWV